MLIFLKTGSSLCFVSLSDIDPTESQILKQLDSNIDLLTNGVSFGAELSVCLTNSRRDLRFRFLTLVM